MDKEEIKEHHEIEYTYEGETVKYHSQRHSVYFETKDGVKITCEIPNWANTRIFQFMEAFVKSVKTS